MTFAFFIGFIWLVVFLRGFDGIIESASDLRVYAKMAFMLFCAAIGPILVLMTYVMHVVATIYRVLTHRPTPMLDERLEEILEKLDT